METRSTHITVKIATIFVAVAMLAGCTGGGQSNSTTPPSTVETPVALATTNTEVAPASAVAEIVFQNGMVLTMDPAGSQAQAVAIQGGKILAVGNNEEIAAYIGDQTQVIDLQGQTLMPGFVDSHDHIFFNIFKETDDPEEAENWLLSQGITTIAEMSVEPDLFDWILNAYQSGKLRVRSALYLEYVNSCGDVIGPWYQDHPSAHLMDDFLRVPGIKIYADGGACNQPAVSFEYQGGGSGNLYFEAADLSQVIVEAQEQGYQVAIHALGDRGAELALDAIEAALNGQPNVYRHRIEHNTLLRDDLLPRYGEIGVVPLIFGKFPTCFFNGDTSQFKYLTPLEYRHWEWRYGDLIRTNPDLIYAWHSDYPVFTSINPIEHLYGFVTRKEIGPNGEVCEPADWAADDVISVDQALRIMTINSAYATFYEDITGSIQAGKYADMIILSENPLQIAPDDLINLSVRMTMVGGKVAFCADGEEAYCPASIMPTTESTPVPNGETTSLQNLARTATVTASNSVADSPAENVLDGDEATAWNSGGDAPQWIELDLGAPRQISEIRLLVAQYPSGATEHHLLIQNAVGEWEELHTFSGSTADGQWLVYTLPQPLEAQRLRVETVQSPSWAAWAEIEVYGD